MNRFTILIITGVTLIFFAAVATDLTPYLRGPSIDQWRWPYQFVNTLNKIWVPGILIAVLLMIFKKLDGVKIKNVWLTLIGVIFLSFLFQISVINFSRAAVGVLLHRITDPGLNGYYTAGINIDDPIRFITNYPNLVLNLPMHAKGHPPGVPIIFYLVNRLIPISNNYVAFGVGLSFAILNSLAIIPLFFSTRSWRAVFFYISIPSLVLFLPLPDVVFPFFGIAAWYFLKNKRYLLSGLVFSIGLFFSYSIIPVIFLLLLEKPKPRFFIPILIYFFLFWQTFITVISGQAQRDYLTWVFYNLWDFVVFAGIPLSLFSLFSFKKSWKYILIILLLSISGISRAETGRIWAPMMVFMVFPVLEYLEDKKFNTNSVIILLALQLIQTLVIQEFWVPLW